MARSYNSTTTKALLTKNGIDLAYEYMDPLFPFNLIPFRVDKRIKKKR
jgi:hypothetical protein